MRMTRLAWLIAESSYHTQYMLAAEAQINPGTLSLYVNGYKPILDTHAARLSNVLGTTGVDGWVELMPA